MMPGIFGTVDGFAGGRLFGWVMDPSNTLPDKLLVRVSVDGAMVGSGPADIPRPGLESIGDGAIAFDFALAPELRLSDFAAKRVRVDAYHRSVRVGAIPLHSAFCKTIAASQLLESFVSLAGALQFLGPTDANELLSASQPGGGKSWTLYLDFLAKLHAEAAGIDLRDSRGQPRAAVVREFESLGNNCEFGLVQRHFGVEGAGLLRWGSCQEGFAGLVRAVQRRFEGAGNDIKLFEHGNEYVSVDHANCLVFHTDRIVGQDDPELLLRNERNRIPYLARNLIDDMADASRIFVIKDENIIDEEDILPLFYAMREVGPISLLWVTVACTPGDVGVVDTLRPHLMRGYIDRFSPLTNIYEYCSFEVWLDLCEQTYRLVHAASRTQ